MITNDASHDVFILGAGFSMALSDHMPLTDELGNVAASTAGINITREFESGRFEAWLSRLAERQPDLSPIQNAENAVRFAKLQEAIAAAMSERQRLAQGDGLPHWALDFVSALHASRATVVTFNYDLIIEWMFEELQIWDFGRGEQLQWFYPLRDLPPFSPAPARLSAHGLPATMELLKLHGSLNWFWVPGDSSGATLNKWDLDFESEERQRYLPGRAPFIVPPLALKSAYLSNPVVSQIWQNAATALRGARRVFLVGYSLPMSDLAVGGMIADALEGSNAKVTIVNPHFSPVHHSLHQLTGRDDFEVVTTVEEAARRYTADTSQRLVQQLLTVERPNRPAPLLAGWNPNCMSVVNRVERTGSSVTLRCDETPAGTATQPREIPSVTVGELLDVLTPDDELLVSYPGVSPHHVVGLSLHRTSTGVSTRWQVLVPACPPLGRYPTGASDTRLT